MENKEFNFELGVLKTDTFSKMYPVINNYLWNVKDWEDSRGGKVKEILDFKTVLTNPYRRCVGGYGRDINVFFLLVEAIWIVMGRSDVQTLTNFNKKMADFSDDGVTFHAPYGHRLRHWGIPTEGKRRSDGMITSTRGIDQVSDAIRMLSEDPNSRQVVMSIWNPDLDLGFKTKDIPCNDMVFLKIRNGKLITTIANRSNDLHWGLPTNIFQFSFLTEIMSLCLGIELGTQTHNSQSLHIYDWNDIAPRMAERYAECRNLNRKYQDLYYDFAAGEVKIDFAFTHEVPVNRFREIEFALHAMLKNLSNIASGLEEIKENVNDLAGTSMYLYNVYTLLKIYLEYKIQISETKDPMVKMEARRIALSKMDFYQIDDCWDIGALARNFFVSRMNSDNNHKLLGNL